MVDLVLKRLLFLLLFLSIAIAISIPPSSSAAARKGQRKLVLIFADDQATKRSPNQEKLINTESLLLHSSEDKESSVLDHEEQEEEDFSDFDDLNPEDLDPGSWKTIAEDYGEIEEKRDSDMSSSSSSPSIVSEDFLYIEGVRKMLDAATYGDPDTLSAAVSQFRKAADEGHAHAQSTLAFLYGNGIGVEHSDSKAFLYHSFAAESGNFQSKLALAYGYFRQQVFISPLFSGFSLFILFGAIPMCLLESIKHSIIVMYGYPVLLLLHKLP